MFGARPSCWWRTVVLAILENDHDDAGKAQDIPYWRPPPRARPSAWPQEHAGRIDLVMTDVVMPEMNGRDLAKNLLSLYPNLKRLFMSGYTANVIAHHGVLDESVHFIQKPFSKGDLAHKLREALEG